MKTADLVIVNPTGLHARPAKVLVALAKRFKADVVVRYSQKKANAKSMVSILTLGAAKGACITVETSGEDEEQALTAIEEAVRAGLGDLEEGAAPAPAPVVEAVASGFGIGAAPGIAIGPVFQLRPARIDVEALAGAGLADLESAVMRAVAELGELSHRMANRGFGAEAAIFDAQAELLSDPELMADVRARTGLDAAKAWSAAIEERAIAIGALKDATLSARADDMRDVGRRVLGGMLGVQGTTLPETPVIVLARELSPSETAAFDPERVLGFCITGGGPTSHIAILARAMGIPAIVSAKPSLLDIPEGTRVILDGGQGTLDVNPGLDVLNKAFEAQKAWQENRRAAREQTALPAITTDGRRVEVAGNAGSAANAVEAVKVSADGIGLLRTEFLFLERTTAPSEDEQFEVYRTIAQTMNPHPVIVRTLDIGGDKPVPYLELPPEENPFLGERGIRLCLNHPGLFREQLRAILRASTHGHLKIMFPMVSEVGELRQAKVLIEELCAELGVPPVSVGIMVEVPSAALLADSLAQEADFFSIGTNDLTQYTLAMDRGNASLAARQDGLHPAVLRLIALTAEGAHRHGRMVGVCGELGSDPLAVPILIGLGVDELSVSVPSIPTVKAQVRSLSAAALGELAQRALACSTAQEVRALVRSFAP